ncbi:GEVED domain-containing protein, partial [uncultured Chryseobacterium sp.]|uniref:GEVED domain-containing protein n=1 Tax=uncultured Chryseobacterium sp. TaxID=259322 RepID=UPI0025DFBD31
LSTIQDQTTGTNPTVVDERAIADGLISGAYQYASYGEVEDYQLTVTRDFGDAPVSYENGSASTAASQTNDATGLASFTMGTTIDYELSPASVTSPADNNGTNGDGLDEDAVSTPQTVRSGLPFSITIPVNNKTTANRYAYVYAWIDLNGDGKFSGDEAGTASATPLVAATNGTANVTFTWSNTNASTSVITAGKTYVRFRLSDTSLTNANSGTATSIDTRSYGVGTGDGEVEDYQFLVNTTYDFGDAPTSYDMNKDGTATTNYKPARNLPSSQLSLGSSYTLETAPLSVAAGADNNGSNGDGISDDGLSASQLNIRTNLVNNYVVNVKNTTGSNAMLYAWLDTNSNGRFEAGEYTAVNVANNATTATISFSAVQVNLIPAATSKVYLRLRLIQPSAGASIADDNFTATTNTVVDERAIADGLSTGDYGIASYGEVEDYQLTVTRDYGDVPTSYETVASVFTPATQTNDPAGTATFTMGTTIDYELTPASVTSPSDNNGTNGDGADEDAVSTPQTVKSGLPFSITIPVNNKTSAAKYAYIYAWIDLNGDGKFSGDEAGTTSATPLVAATNGTASVTFTWSNTNASTSVITAGKTYVRFRLSDTSLTNGNYGSGTATDLAKIDTRSYGAGYGDGEVEDYQFVITNLYDNGDVPVSYEQPVGNFVPARQAADDNLYIGGKPDEETLPNSVSNGADNNNPNGDGADEDGISNPTLFKVTPTQTFSLTVPVTNKTGSAKYLYGWLDANNNGIFEDNEAVVSSAINSSATSTSVTVTWPASVTAQIASDNVYVRFRLSAAALNNNTATTYDERAIADGTQTTGAYYQSTIGEVEDYRFGVNPVFDFGDAPNSYELNTNNDVIPARHIPGSTLYLGGTYDIETSKNAVAAGADNGGTNGDGADEDGITGTLPQLNGNITTYSVNVNVYKTLAGTATLHGWIDMDGDGRFSSSEYTSASVTGTSGAQTVVLTWSSPFYFDTGATRSYMRLRLTTVALADNTATLQVDERSIADGLSTGLYTTGTAFANGEIEDYPVPLPAPVVIDPNLDSDGDGVKDVNDLDADNDGIPDSVEGPVSLNDSAFKLYNTPTVNVAGQARWNLYITGTAGTSITYKPFNGSNITTTIPSAGILAINLTQSQIPDWPTNQVTNGKFVTVSSSAPVSIVQEIYGDNFSADAAVVYPPSIWGNKYTISAYVNPSGFNRGIQIISSTDSNNVIVKNKAGNTVASFTVNSGQNYIADFAPGTDISGYTVSSSKNVGIMVYNLCANATGGACDNTLEYLLPDRLLGTKFFTRSPANTGLMQITATQNNTAIRVDGSTVAVLANAGDTYTYTQSIGSAQIIETNNPVQFIKVVPYDSDPSVTTIQDVNKATLGPAKMIVPSSMTASNNLTIFVKTAQTSKMLYNGNPITGWAAFSYDSSYSYVTLTAADGIIAGSSVSISSTTGDVAFFTDWYGTGSSISDATPLSIGGVSLLSGSSSANSFKDTDGDGIPDYLDLDSDNDGCLDALEGSASITSSQLVNAGGTVTVGTGSTASNRNLCAGNSCVNSQGIPQFASPPSGYSNTTGQGVGTSIDPLIQDAVCLVPPFCYKPAATGGTTLDTKHGITALGRAGTDNGNWPMVRKGAWTALESKEKGFVINRVATTAGLSTITNPVEGMIVYDQQAQCLKMYTVKEGDSSPAWHCITTQTCPD